MSPGMTHASSVCRLDLFACPGAVFNKSDALCIDGAVQRPHPGRHAAREEDHRDGHCRPGAREVKQQLTKHAHTPYLQSA